MMKSNLHILYQALKCSLLSVFRTGYFYRSLALEEESRETPISVYMLSSLIPIFLTTLLLILLGIIAGDPSLLVIIGFSIMTLFMAGGVFLLIGAFFGIPRGYLCVVLGWAHSYWATALFLGLLAGTHFLPNLFGTSPSSVPLLVKYIFLSLYITAWVWKFLFMISLLKYLFKINGLRLFVAVIFLMIVVIGFTLFSAIFIGTKVPII